MNYGEVILQNAVVYLWKEKELVVAVQCEMMNRANVGSATGMMYAPCGASSRLLHSAAFSYS